MNALTLLHWLLFSGTVLVWLTFCGANLIIAFSHHSPERPSFLPGIGGVAGAAAVLMMPAVLAPTALHVQLLLAMVLFSSDPCWLAPLLRRTTR